MLCGICFSGVSLGFEGGLEMPQKSSKIFAIFGPTFFFILGGIVCVVWANEKLLFTPFPKDSEKSLWNMKKFFGSSLRHIYDNFKKCSDH